MLNKKIKKQLFLSFTVESPKSLLLFAGSDKLKSVVTGHGYTVHNVPMDGSYAIHAIIDQHHCLDGPTDTDVVYTTVEL